MRKKEKERDDKAVDNSVYDLVDAEASFAGRGLMALELQ